MPLEGEVQDKFKVWGRGNRRMALSRSGRVKKSGEPAGGGQGLGVGFGAVGGEASCPPEGRPGAGGRERVYEDTHLGAVSTWVGLKAEELGEVTWGVSDVSQTESGAAGHTQRFEREQKCVQRAGERRAREVRAKTRPGKSQSQVGEAGG